MCEKASASVLSLSCVRRAFSVSEQFYRNLPSGILFSPPPASAWEGEARELQSSVKLNGGNKFWAISGQCARAPPSRAILRSAIFIFVNAICRAIFAKGDLSLRKGLQIFNTLTFMAVAEE